MWPAQLPQNKVSTRNMVILVLYITNEQSYTGQVSWGDFCCKFAINLKLSSYVAVSRVHMASVFTALHVVNTCIYEDRILDSGSTNQSRRRVT